jgi:hypothetical protein
MGRYGNPGLFFRIGHAELDAISPPAVRLSSAGLRNIPSDGIRILAIALDGLRAIVRVICNGGSSFTSLPTMTSRCIEDTATNLVTTPYQCSSKVENFVDGGVFLAGKMAAAGLGKISRSLGVWWRRLGTILRREICHCQRIDSFIDKSDYRTRERPLPLESDGLLP